MMNEINPKMLGERSLYLKDFRSSRGLTNYEGHPIR